MKIKELLNKKSKWTKGAFARTDRYTQVAIDSPLAIRYCLSGAIQRCYPVPHEGIIIAIKILRELNGDLTIVGWNDAPERTFVEVKELVERLDI